MDQRLSPAQAAAVARCIDQLADRPGVPLTTASSSPRGGPYLAAIPDDVDAPVVIYRRTTPGEQGDFFVTALADRATYAECVRAAQHDGQDHPLDRVLSLLATAQILGGGRVSPAAP
jgi:hypothetical protein